MNKHNYNSRNIVPLDIIGVLKEVAHGRKRGGMTENTIVQTINAIESVRHPVHTEEVLKELLICLCNQNEHLLESLYDIKRRSPQAIIKAEKN